MNADSNFPGGRRLPHCEFPAAADTGLHGLQPLPEVLPVIDFASGQLFRSRNIKIVTADSLNTSKLFHLLRVMAQSFAVNEPILRHLIPQEDRPDALQHIKHKDPFGDSDFGNWTKENIVFWFIRLFVITDPFTPLDDVQVSNDTLTQSLAVLNEYGDVIGGGLNVAIDLSGAGKAMRSNDPFINAIFPFLEPVSQFVAGQINLSLQTLCKTYPSFREALKAGKVGDLNMIARSPFLPKEDTFELMAASAERFAALGFAYMIVSASNQWTGAACETLSATRVHFAPFRDMKRVHESADPVSGKTSSHDGFLSDKDSGCMLYVLRLV